MKERITMIYLYIARAINLARGFSLRFLRPSHRTSGTQQPYKILRHLNSDISISSGLAEQYRMWTLINVLQLADSKPWRFWCTLSWIPYFWLLRDTLTRLSMSNYYMHVYVCKQYVCIHTHKRAWYGLINRYQVWMTHWRSCVIPVGTSRLQHCTVRYSLAYMWIRTSRREWSLKS